MYTKSWKRREKAVSAVFSSNNRMDRHTLISSEGSLKIT
jgi:hypothetical protein